jgi:probable HAF family extracellular repeat protein
VVVGQTAFEAYRWTQDGGAVGLGDLPAGGFNSIAYDVSSDGNVVVGHGRSAAGTEAFVWTAQDGMAGLGDLPGGPFHSEARGVSADGSVVVGFSDSATDRQAFRWTAGNGMVGLTPGVISVAVDVSADGSLITGASAQHGAFIWDELHGVRSLETMLGLDLGDWLAIQPEGISDDGSTIIGFGIHLNGDNEAWIAVLPEPSSVALLSFGGLIAALRRPREC